MFYCMLVSGALTRNWLDFWVCVWMHVGVCINVWWCVHRYVCVCVWHGRIVALCVFMDVCVWIWGMVCMNVLLCVWMWVFESVWMPLLACMACMCIDVCLCVLWHQALWTHMTVSAFPKSRVCVWGVHQSCSLPAAHTQRELSSRLRCRDDWDKLKSLIKAEQNN